MKYDFIKNNKKNKFYNVGEDEIDKFEKELKICVPPDLKAFLLEVGYGFIAGSDCNVNRIMDLESIRDFRLRQGDFEFYPDIEIYNEYEDGKLVFFEGNESALISMELTEQENSRIYYYDVKIADSLIEFLDKIEENDNYYLEMLE